MYLAQYMTGEGSTGVGERGSRRSEGSGRQGTIYPACKPSDARGYIHRGRRMYIEVGIYVGRAGDKVLSVSAPRGRGCHLPVYLGLPLMSTHGRKV